MPTVVAVLNLAVGNTTFTTCLSAKNVKSIKGKFQEEYSMSAVDMCMINNMIDNGVDNELKAR